MTKSITRRGFLRYASFGLIAATAGSSVLSKAVRAEQANTISLDDPLAKALGYVSVSAVDGQSCDNCKHAKGAVGDEWTPCALFQMKLVAKDGWCKGWVAKG